MFNKGFELVVVDAYNKKADRSKEIAKGKAAGAREISFPEIAKRPKGNPEKLKPFYYAASWEPLPLVKGTWDVREKEYLWALTSDGRTASGGWSILAVSAGSLLESAPFTLSKQGTDKNALTILMRTAPVVDIEKGE